MAHVANDAAYAREMGSNQVDFEVAAASPDFVVKKADCARIALQNLRKGAPRLPISSRTIIPENPASTA
jgi:hypothetical protein